MAAHQLGVPLAIFDFGLVEESEAPIPEMHQLSA